MQTYLANKVDSDSHLEKYQPEVALDCELEVYDPNMTS